MIGARAGGLAKGAGNQAGRVPARARYGIQGLLLGLVGALMVPLVLLVVFLLYRDAAENELRQRAALLDSAQARAGAVEALLAQIGMFFERVPPARLAAALAAGRCDAALAELLALHPGGTKVGIRTARGEWLCLPADEERLFEDPALRSEWRDAERAGGLHVSDVLAVGERKGIAVSLALGARGQRKAPLIGTFLPLDAFDQVVSPSRLPAGSVALLTDRQGTVLTRSLDAARWRGRPGAGAAALAAALAHPEGNARAVGLDGVERFYAFTALPGVGWKVTVGVPSEELARASRRQVTYGLLLWGSILALACAAALALGRAITRPTLELRQLVEAAAKGFFHFPIRPRGPAEIAALTEEFNTMVAARQAIEGELKRSVERGLRQEQELRAMASRLAGLQEKERRDIARELHDRAGQNLSALSLNLASLSVRGGDAAAQIADCRRLVEATGLVIQDVLTELKPPMLASYGLVDALRFHAREFSRRARVPVEVRGDGTRLDAVIELALFRIAQAALHNIARHAGAGRIDICLDTEGGAVRFEVRDDGVGFDPAAALASGRWGLTAMRERAEAIGGRLEVDSAPGRGARIAVTLPA